MLLNLLKIRGEISDEENCDNRKRRDRNFAGGQLRQRHGKFSRADEIDVQKKNENTGQPKFDCLFSCRFFDALFSCFRFFF